MPDNPADPLNPPILERLLELPTLGELHLWPAKFYRSDEKLQYDNYPDLFLPEFLEIFTCLRMPEHPPRIYVLGVTLNRILDWERGGFGDLSTETPTLRQHNFDSLALLHYLNRDELAEKFPSCSNLSLCSEIVGPALFGEDRLDLRSKYPFIQEVNIRVPNLIAQVLVRLPDLNQTEKFAVFERLLFYFDQCSENDFISLDQHDNFKRLEKRLKELRLLSLQQQVDPRQLEDLANEFVSVDTELNRLPQNLVAPLRHLALSGIHVDHYSRGETWLLEFIANLPHLAALSITESGLTQDFFDRLLQLPGLATSLNKLTLEDNQREDLIINLNLLIRFERLCWFESNLLTHNLLHDDLFREFISSRLRCTGFCSLKFNTTSPGRSNVKIKHFFRFTKYQEGLPVSTLYDLYQDSEMHHLARTKSFEFQKNGLSFNRLMKRVLRNLLSNLNFQ